MDDGVPKSASKTKGTEGGVATAHVADAGAGGARAKVIGASVATTGNSKAPDAGAGASEATDVHSALLESKGSEIYSSSSFFVFIILPPFSYRFQSTIRYYSL